MPCIYMYSGKGILAGKKAFLTKWVNSIESFPPENGNTGFSNCTAIYRITKIASGALFTLRDSIHNYPYGLL